MAEIPLIGQTPGEQAARDQRVSEWIVNVRIDVASKIMAGLMQVHYNRHLNRIQKQKGKANPHGENVRSVDGDPWQNMELLIPAVLAREAGDALLNQLGVLRPRQADPSQSSGE